MPGSDAGLLHTLSACCMYGTASASFPDLLHSSIRLARAWKKSGERERERECVCMCTACTQTTDLVSLPAGADSGQLPSRNSPSETKDLPSTASEVKKMDS